VAAPVSEQPLIEKTTEVPVILLLLPVAMAQTPEAIPEPPGGDVLLEAARQGLMHPPGCHMMQGTITTKIGVGPMRDEEVHAMTGTLNEGVWSDLAWETVEDKKSGMSFHVDSDEDDELEMTPFFPPTFGKTNAAGKDLLGADMILDGVMSEYLPDTATVTSMYDYIGDTKVFAVARLQTMVRERKSRDVSLYALFDMDTLQPRSWRVSMDKGVKVDNVKIRDVVIGMEADSTGVPTSEHMEGVIRHGPFVIRVGQDIVYSRVGDCS